MARAPVAGALVIPSGAEFKLVWSDGVQEFSNVLHGRYATPPTFGAALAQSVFTVINSALTTSGWTARMSSTVSLLRVELKDINSAFNPAWLSSGAPVVGTGATTPLPANVAICVSLRTARAGKGWIGRTYLGGLDQVVQLNAHECTQAAATDGQEFLDAIRTGLTSTGFTLALAQRALQAGTTASGAPMPPRSANMEPITHAQTTDNRLDAQRKRLG